MSDETTQAASSPAVEVDPFEGQSPTVHEFNQYRVTGEVPARFKAEPVDPAPTAEGDEPENEPDPAPDSDQETPEGIGNKARRRFEKLLAENKALKAAQQAKPDAPPAPSAAPPAQQTITRPKPTLKDTNEDGSLKYGDYAMFVEDLGTWSAEQTLHAAEQRRMQQEQQRQVNERVESDRARYGDELDKVIAPAAAAIMGNKKVPIEVKRMIAGSDVAADVLFTLGSDDKTMQKLVNLSQTDPHQAMFYIADLSANIRRELEAGDSDESDGKEPTPEPKKTSAPKPPVPVSGPSSRAFDVSDESLSPEQWMRKRNAQLNQRG